MGNERDNSHELYNVGHMYEAAVAHYLATGKRSFLDIAIKSANLLCNTFGPEEEKITVAPGHQEVEIGLVKLYRVTGDKRYLDLSQFFWRLVESMTNMIGIVRISSVTDLIGRIISQSLLRMRL